MSKEWLERAVGLNKAINDYYFSHNDRRALQTLEQMFQENLIDYLIIEAVRVQELEESEREWVLFQIQMNSANQKLEKENKRYRELLLRIFKVTQNHQIGKISNYAFGRAGMLFYEWLGTSGAFDLDRYFNEVNGHDDYDDYNIERLIDEMIKTLEEKQ